MNAKYPNAGFKQLFCTFGSDFGDFGVTGDSDSVLEIDGFLESFLGEVLIFGEAFFFALALLFFGVSAFSIGATSSSIDTFLVALVAYDFSMIGFFMNSCSFM